MDVYKYTYKESRLSGWLPAVVLSLSLFLFSGFAVHTFPQQKQDAGVELVISKKKQPPNTVSCNQTLLFFNNATFSKSFPKPEIFNVIRHHNRLATIELKATSASLLKFEPVAFSLPIKIISDSSDQDSPDFIG